MPGPAVDVIRQLSEVESDQRYTRLVELFTDDAVYYDPFLGAQRGRDEIQRFMAHMEEVVPRAGVRFDGWEIEADRSCGWARWTMCAPGPDGVEVPVPGQSLYRLRDGRLAFAADYVDPRAYARLRPGGPAPDLGGAAGLCPGVEQGPAWAVIAEFWQRQERARYGELAELFAPDAVFTDLIYGRFEGSDAIAGYLRRMESELPEVGVRFELVDGAGDEQVAWTQWTCHVPTGPVPGWTLHMVRDGRITLDADYFDTAVAAALTAG